MLRYILLVLFTLVIAPVRAEPLSFETALRIAARSSPDIAVQSANVSAARSSATASGRLPDPKLAVGIENLPVTGPDQWSLTRDFMTMRKIGVMQQIPNAAKRAAQSAGAEAAVSRAEAERRVSILKAQTETAVAWLDRYYLDRRGALFDELERENQLFSDAVRAQLAAGRATPAEVVEPQEEAADIADRRDELTAQIAKSKAVLERWVGAAADAPLAGEPPALVLDAEGLRGHVHQHPELTAYIPMTQMAQAAVHEAEANKRPDWGVELAYARRGSAYSDMVSLEFTLDLPLFTKNRQDPQIRARRAELSRVESERDAMFRDHTQELEDDLAVYDMTTRQLARLRDTRLDLAEQKAQYTFASYRGGTGDLASVLAARRERIDVRLKRIELEGKRAVAAARLYYFYGPGAAQTSSELGDTK